MYITMTYSHIIYCQHNNDIIFILHHYYLALFDIVDLVFFNIGTT